MKYAGTGGTQNFTAVNWQYMRYTLCTTLLNDGFYLYEDDASGYGNSLWWFDEYDNAGRAEATSASPGVPATRSAPTCGAATTTAASRW